MVSNGTSASDINSVRVTPDVNRFIKTVDVICVTTSTQLTQPGDNSCRCKIGERQSPFTMQQYERYLLVNCYTVT